MRFITRKYSTFSYTHDCSIYELCLSYALIRDDNNDDDDDDIVQ